MYCVVFIDSRGRVAKMSAPRRFGGDKIEHVDGVLKRTDRRPTSECELNAREGQARQISLVYTRVVVEFK